MVTCKFDALPKMSRPRKASSTSSGFRLLDGDQLDTISNVSRNSIYKLKIDSMFDDSRSVVSQRLDDRRGSRRTASIIMYGKNELAANRNATTRDNDSEKGFANEKTPAQQDIRKISNSVQAQIERLFTDVAKDATSSSFSVRCLGSLPLKDKVTSLQGLQEPLRQLYLSGAGQGNQKTGNLDICANGLRVEISAERDPNITPFHNIAVWSAVKFVVSPTEGGAAFLPLITDPENIDKSTLFRPLTAADQRRLSSGLHAPIFAVVMRSSGIPKILECHGFVCQTPEDAIVIAATLYQSLMAHVSTNSNHSSKRRTPRNQNGVSCISIASSSALANSNYAGLKSNNMPVGRKNSFRNASKIPPATPVRPTRKKRMATSSLSGESDTIREIIETTTEERKKKSHKTKRAPPIPIEKTSNRTKSSSELLNSSMSFLEKQNRARNSSLPSESLYHANDGSTGDILTKVAIPRSGSFLNTGGLSRYKSRATRRNSGKNCGGGGSPLGFSELFNEFRLNENLHSLDDILNAIINADGMSFNDLKPIYKEFLLKLAVTLTKDELYQRSKNIMRRQKKRKLKRRNSNTQKKHRSLILGAKGLKKVFWFGQFRSCTTSKTGKSMNSKQISSTHQQHLTTNNAPAKNSSHRTRTGTSGSDVSETRNENNTLNGPNRNSSSGYVSCSECSYDSEACTCTSADRCYCSLGADHDRVHEKLSRNRAAQDTMLSCKMEDKCYCSVANNHEDTSDTTWCDSDSCISTSKCYCKRNHHEQNINNKGKRSSSEKLAVDYELFTVGGDGKSVKPHEALSVKKSVEVAAVFADVKLSQTTDMDYMKKGIKQHKDSICSNKNNNNNRRKKSQKSSSANDILSKLEAIDKSNFRRNSSNNDGGYYQSMKAISASLEDSLGYLP